MVDGDSCIICLQENKTSNPLVEAKEIFESNCGCSYNVHKLCINEWVKVKQKDFLCINCNSPAKIKNEDFINITIDNYPNTENIPIHNQFMIERTQTTGEEGEADCNEELDKLCSPTFRITVCFWTIVIIIIILLIHR